jgi:hypothetical protein
LLSEDFAGCVELRKQIPYCTTRALPGVENTFEIRVDPRAPKAEVEVYVPAEAHYRNMERSQALRLSGGPGALIAILLHVGDDGYLQEVEQEFAVPPELFGPVPDITEFELRIREWTFLEGG